MADRIINKNESKERKLLKETERRKSRSAMVFSDLKVNSKLVER